MTVSIVNLHIFGKENHICIWLCPSGDVRPRLTVNTLAVNVAILRGIIKEASVIVF